MFNILVVPDSFKDSISSAGIIASLKKGFEQFDPSIRVLGLVASDGGEGFLMAVENQLDVDRIYHDTLDPIGRPVEAYYLLDTNKAIAFIELAQASGLERLAAGERNPLYTTTSGTGMQIFHAINKGAKKIFVGLGGSATNDGGIGMASVLGYRFLDKASMPVLPIGNHLGDIVKIEGDYGFPAVEIVAVTDVQNQLYGTDGAAHTYGAQKGASQNELDMLDRGLRNLNALAESELGRYEAESAGSGAAGGAAFGLKVFMNASAMSGIDFFIDLSDFESILVNEKIDLVITGEGRIDSQSFNGKLIDGVIKSASKFNIPVMAICGQLDLTEAEYRSFGLSFATTIAGPETSKEESMNHPGPLIEATAAKLKNEINRIL